jgi:hypothetical protein
VAVGTAQILASRARSPQGGMVSEWSLRVVHGPATADERRVKPERGGTEPTNGDGASRRRGNVEMAQAVLAENPERVRRKPNSLGVSRVRLVRRGGAAQDLILRDHSSQAALSAALRPGGRCSRLPHTPCEGGRDLFRESSRFLAKSNQCFGWTLILPRPTFSFVAGTGDWTGDFRPARVGPGVRKGHGNVQPDTPRKGWRRPRKGPSEAAFGL